MVEDNDEAIEPVEWRSVKPSSLESITAFTRLGKE